jgi:hypothetical protein
VRRFLPFSTNTEKAYRSWLLRSGAPETDAQVRRALRTLDLRQVGEALFYESALRMPFILPNR